MTINFRCDCGRVLMASDEQAGLEGQCPACGQIMRIPQVETTGMEELEDGVFAEPFDEGGVEKEELMEIKEVEDMEKDMEEEVAAVEDQPEVGNGRRSPRFAILASILVVVLVALVVFMFVRKEKEPSEEVVIIQKMEPAVAPEEETVTPPVGALFEEEATEGVTLEEEATEGVTTEEDLVFEEEEPMMPSVTEEESVEQLLTESPAEMETELGPSEEEEQDVASLPVETSPAEETPPAEETVSASKMPPVGSFTINVASFKAKESAERYAEELRQQGLDAFDWEILLPEKGLWYRVSVGGFPTRQEAENYAGELTQMGITDIFITKIPGSS